MTKKKQIIWCGNPKADHHLNKCHGNLRTDRFVVHPVSSSSHSVIIITVIRLIRYDDEGDDDDNIFDCKWAVTWWQWLLCMYINMK
jgi:hypothetical protein